MAVSASILTAIYVMLKNGVVYADLGADHLSRADRIKTANRLLRKLGDLGFEVRDMRDRTAA
jgi:transposase